MEPTFSQYALSPNWGRHLEELAGILVRKPDTKLLGHALGEALSVPIGNFDIHTQTGPFSVSSFSSLLTKAKSSSLYRLLALAELTPALCATNLHMEATVLVRDICRAIRTQGEEHPANLLRVLAPLTHAALLIGKREIWDLVLHKGREIQASQRTPEQQIFSERGYPNHAPWKPALSILESRKDWQAVLQILDATISPEGQAHYLFEILSYPERTRGNNFACMTYRAGQLTKYLVGRSGTAGDRVCLALCQNYAEAGSPELAEQFAPMVRDPAMRAHALGACCAGHLRNVSAGAKGDLLGVSRVHDALKLLIAEQSKWSDTAYGINFLDKCFWFNNLPESIIITCMKGVPTARESMQVEATLALREFAIGRQDAGERRLLELAKTFKNADRHEYACMTLERLLYLATLNFRGREFALARESICNFVAGTCPKKERSDLDFSTRRDMVEGLARLGAWEQAEYVYEQIPHGNENRPKAAMMIAKAALKQGQAELATKWFQDAATESHIHVTTEAVAIQKTPNFESSYDLKNAEPGETPWSSSVMEPAFEKRWKEHAQNFKETIARAGELGQLATTLGSAGCKVQARQFALEAAAEI